MADINQLTLGRQVTGDYDLPETQLPGPDRVPDFLTITVPGNVSCSVSNHLLSRNQVHIPGDDALDLLDVNVLDVGRLLEYQGKQRLVGAEVGQYNLLPFLKAVLTELVQ
ncbi:hypothetical protein ES703_114738 [subsurface metagenome]